MKKLLLVLTLSSLMALSYAAPAFASSTVAQATPPTGSLFNDAKNDACAGTQLSGAAGGCDQGQVTTLNQRIRAGLNIFSIVITIIAVIMLMVSGLRFIVAGGDANKVASARNGIIFALVGLAVVAVAQIIVRFVVGAVTT